MLNKFREIINKNETLCLFLICFFILSILGFYVLTCSRSLDNNIFFGTDTSRVLETFWYGINFKHDRIDVHPFQLVLLQPIFYSVYSFIRSTFAATVIVQSVISAVNICLVKSIIYKFTQNKKMALILALIFGFSFSSLIFTIVPENYIFGTFFELLLFYYMSILFLNEKQLTVGSMFILALYTVFAFGIIPILTIQNFILVLWLLFRKTKSFKVFIKHFAIFFVSVLVLYFAFLFLQKYTYTENFIIHRFKFEVINLDYTLYWGKIVKLFNDLLLYSFYAVRLNQYYNINGISVIIPDAGFMEYIPIILFLSILCGCYIKNLKRNKYNDLIFIILGIILLHYCFYSLYCNFECFLYTQNIVPFYIILFGLMLSPIKNCPLIVSCSGVCFFVYQTILNFKQIQILPMLTYKATSRHFNMFDFKYILYAFVSTLFIGAFIILMKKFLKAEIINMDAEKKYIICSVMYLVYMVMCAIFLVLFKEKAF